MNNDTFQVCPICHGTGNIEIPDLDGIYDGTIKVKCTNCNGKGIIHLLVFSGVIPVPIKNGEKQPIVKLNIIH